MSIGRGEGADLVLNDDNVSRHHAEITFELTGRSAITDRRSTNGVFVNNVNAGRQPRELRDGDLILLGNTYIQFFVFR